MTELIFMLFLFASTLDVSPRRGMIDFVSEKIINSLETLNYIQLSST